MVLQLQVLAQLTIAQHHVAFTFISVGRGQPQDKKGFVVSLLQQGNIN